VVGYQPPPWIWRASETLVFYHNTTQHHNTEELDLNHHCHESLKLSTFIQVYQAKHWRFTFYCENIFVRKWIFSCCYHEKKNTTSCYFTNDTQIWWTVRQKATLAISQNQACENCGPQPLQGITLLLYMLYSFGYTSTRLQIWQLWSRKQNRDSILFFIMAYKYKTLRTC
jgi:hypothetical protein